MTPPRSAHRLARRLATVAFVLLAVLLISIGCDRRAPEPQAPPGLDDASLMLVTEHYYEGTGKYRAPACAVQGLEYAAKHSEAYTWAYCLDAAHPHRGHGAPIAIRREEGTGLYQVADSSRWGAVPVPAHLETRTETRLGIDTAGLRRRALARAATKGRTS